MVSEQVQINGARNQAQNTYWMVSDNIQEIQGQLDYHSNQIGVLDARMERMELSFASMKALLEERLPPRQPAPPVQTEPQTGQSGQSRAQSGHSGAQARQSGQIRGMQGDGEKPPMVELGEPIPIGVEARNAMPGRPPTHEVFQNLNPPRQPRQFGEPIEPRPFRPNGDPFLT